MVTTAPEPQEVRPAMVTMPPEPPRLTRKRYDRRQKQHSSIRSAPSICIGCLCFLLPIFIPKYCFRESSYRDAQAEDARIQSKNLARNSNSMGGGYGRGESSGLNESTNSVPGKMSLTRLPVRGLQSSSRSNIKQGRQGQEPGTKTQDSTSRRSFHSNQEGTNTRMRHDV